MNRAARTASSSWRASGRRPSARGKGYQTLINEALNRLPGLAPEPLTTETMRAILREELAAARR